MREGEPRWSVTPPWYVQQGKWLVLGTIAALITWLFWPEPEYSYPPGKLIEEVPTQTETAGGSISKEGFAITPLFDFQLRARVLSKEHYSSDRHAAISPYDLALGWEEMSDQRYIDQLEIRQGSRFYAYSWGPEARGLSRTAIAQNSANMHLIPATEELEDLIGSVQRGDIIQLSGQLVHVIAPDGGTWRSSTTRNDTGNGACEIIYVEGFEVITAQYNPL